MTSLDQHVLINMQKVERTGDKLDRTSNTVTGLVDFVAGSFRPWQKYWFCEKSLRHSTLSPVCTGLHNIITVHNIIQPTWPTIHYIAYKIFRVKFLSSSTNLFGLVRRPCPTCLQCFNEKFTPILKRLGTTDRVAQKFLKSPTWLVWFLAWTKKKISSCTWRPI